MNSLYFLFQNFFLGLKILIYIIERANTIHIMANVTRIVRIYSGFIFVFLLTRYFIFLRSNRRFWFLILVLKLIYIIELRIIHVLYLFKLKPSLFWFRQIRLILKLLKTHLYLRNLRAFICGFKLVRQLIRT